MTLTLLQVSLVEPRLDQRLVNIWGYPKSEEREARDKDSEGELALTDEKPFDHAFHSHSDGQQ